MPGRAVAPTFFTGLVAFRRWLKGNGATAGELVVGFYTVGSGRPSITYPDARDEALCWGWIDGIRRRLDDVSYSIRFTPRRPKSIWSLVNLGRVKELTKDGRMQPPGLAAFAIREGARTGVYSFEQRAVHLGPDEDKVFRKNRAAWEHWSAQPPYYRKMASGWVIRAMREETRGRRLAQLIAHSSKGERLPQFGPLPKKKKA